MGCSIYHLNTGVISLLDYFNKTWVNQLTAILPAYYITNCSVEDMLLYNNITSDPKYLAFDYSPYNKRDNGDTYVALLFVLSGSCVSMWMLSLLLYLSPKYKRKPLLTKLATVFYAIITTFFLNKLTRASEKQYYEDVLDIVELHTILYNNVEYRVLIIIFQVLLLLSWFQIIQKLAKQKYKRIIAIVTGVLMAAFSGCFIYYQVEYNTEGRIHMENISGLYLRWKVVRSVMKLILVLWFAGNLLYYTTVVKNPRKICYCKKLLPLAIFNWFLLILHIILGILHISLFEDNWLVRTWMVLIPYLIEAILITTVWEWIFNIWVIEKRIELMGVLGRRISIDDVLSIQLLRGNNTRKGEKTFTKNGSSSDSGGFHGRSGTRKPMAKFQNWIMNRPKRVTTESEILSNNDINELKEFSTFSNSSSNNDPSQRNSNSQLQNQTQQVNTMQRNDDQILQQHNNLHLQNLDTDSAASSSQLQALALHTEDDDVEYDDEYVDDYEIWDDDEDEEEEEEISHHQRVSSTHLVGSTVEENDMHLGSSNNRHGSGDHMDLPPAFQPHPGFEAGDYWNDRKEG